MERIWKSAKQRGSAWDKSGDARAGWLTPLLKCLLFSYIFTAAMLLLLAFLLFQFGLGEKPVSLAIIAIYVAATFLGGFIAGKRVQSRKFLWGLLLGVAYFVVLALVSLAVKQSPGTLGDSFFSTLALCAAGGMLGGMLS